MLRSKNGGNKDGLGLYELLKLAFAQPFCFAIALGMIKFHMYSLAKKFLGIH